MLRRFCSVLCGNAINLPSNVSRAAAPKLLSLVPAKHELSVNFSALAVKIPAINSYVPALTPNKTLLEPKPVITEQKRTVTKFSWKTGKRKTVKAVIHRYYRLAWGAWIKPRSGRHCRLYRKRAKKKLRYLQHVFFKANQTWMLEKMVTKYWKQRRYYPEDPYEPYHERETFWITRKKPLRPEGVDYE